MEKLKVVPAELSGAGAYVLDLARNADSAVQMASKSAASESKDFTGLMELLSGAVTGLSSATQARQKPLVDNLEGTGNELKQSAWDYQAQDHTNHESLMHTVMEGGRVSTVDPLPTAVSYGAPTQVDVSEPAHADVDYRALIDQTMGFVGDVDAKILSLIGWSPVERALRPIAGNWKALESIGEAYGKCGTALGTVGNDLTTARGRLDPHWDGRAAVSFGEYVDHFSRGLEWEAATGRLIQQGLELASGKIQEIVQKILDLLMDSLQKFIDFHDISGTIHTLLKLIPGAGTAKSVEQIVKIIQDIYKTVDFILDQVKKSIKAVEEFLRFVQDPMGYAGDQAQAEIQAKIAPFKKNLDEAKQTVQNTQDFATTADVSRARDTPKDRYEAGPGATPWEDAR